MTETPSRHQLSQDDTVRQYVVEHGNLDDRQVITGAVLVVETVETIRGQEVYGRHRMYPLGPMNPHTVCGLLKKAATDAENC